MAFCPNCGNEIEDDAKFCASCGNPMDGSASAGNADQGSTGSIFGDIKRSGLGFKKKMTRKLYYKMTKLDMIQKFSIYF